MREEQKNINQKPISHEVIHQLRFCGHFLYFRMGDKEGKRRILVALLDHKELLQRELQDVLHIKSGSLSESIIKMEADGLLKKEKSEKDGRCLVLKLTEKGKRRAEQLKQEYDVRVREMLSCLTEEQCEQLHGLLEPVINHWQALEQHWDGETEKKHTKNRHKHKK
ncbi:MAG: MarR family winged helix-turn-helix transcriptional regulator [Acutalibacteraceae bacterium]